MSAAAPQNHGEIRYILLTQCLQNDFFLNRECRLYLGDHAALSVLIGRNAKLPARGGGRLPVSDTAVEQGPLGVFLRAIHDQRRRTGLGMRRPTGAKGTLHVINIRDWHEPGPAYDRERRTYGSHCEQGTWGAEYVQGLGELLAPAGLAADGKAISSVKGSLRVCHVHADSVFDFRPRTDGSDYGQGPAAKLSKTQLEDILDVLVQGRTEDVQAADDALARGESLDAISDLAQDVEERFRESGVQEGLQVYVAVIGVYSDIKVLTLLGGLLARYDLPNLAVSDSLTASATLERHITGLDFAAKVMQVEVVHGVNDLVRYLGGTPPLEKEDALIPGDGFAQFQTFFKDKQSVLAYESEKLQDYLVLTERKALSTYGWFKWSNIFLIAWGSAFLVATLVFAVWAAVDPDVSWAIPAITGGVGLLQLVSAFYTQPMKDLQKNLMNLTTYRLVLESHSLKMALARFHLTTPRTLREVRTSGQAGEAKFQVEVLEREIDAVEKVGSADYEALERLHLGEEPDASRNGKKSAADGTPNGRPAEAEAEAPTVAGADKPG
ncbi:MAG TPA: hypothetical protein VN449_07910 [Gaiellaceae bacterium]|nr:hypothetical protein [Gaiellaceae bacterium]